MNPDQIAERIVGSFKMAKIIKSPESIKGLKGFISIFLGGSISEGKAEDWQTEISKELEERFSDDVVILNPRRDDWDSSWKQTIDFKPFRTQVEWELHAQDIADLRIYYFDPETKSPITLLELGLYAAKKCLVCCPEDYFRKGNVDIVCKKFGIPVFDNRDNFKSELVAQVRHMIQEKM